MFKYMIIHLGRPEYYSAVSVPLVHGSLCHH